MKGVNGKISIVIPVFNSEKSLKILLERIIAVMEDIRREFEVIFVDDCSQDNSWNILKSLKKEYPKNMKIIRLLNNSGQHNAVICGFSMVTGEVVVTMDDDLQNPPEEMPKLIEAIDKGYDLAIGAYDSKKHSGVRNFGGRMVDWVQKKIFGLPVDFSLTSFRAARRVIVDGVLKMGGVFPYVTSMLLSHTSKYTNVSVRHEPRKFGKSNYTFKRSFDLALNLIFSYSSYPLYFVALVASIAFLFALCYGLSVFYKALFHGISVPGWASIAIILSFFNASVLLCFLIFGMYLIRINQQVSQTKVKYEISEIYD
jgi:glycosyltransferase involved in cell wall biosynthesis